MSSRKQADGRASWRSRQGGEVVEGFWASYSDLMAGVLMIFVLSLAMSVQGLLQIEENYEEGQETRAAICDDLQPVIEDNPGVNINCEQGVLSFVDGDNFGFSNTLLPESLKDALSAVVPDWLRVITSDDHWDQIAAIEVSAHTDRDVAPNATNPLTANFFVSKERAFNTMAYLLAEENGSLAGFRDLLREKGVVIGRADTDYPEECGEQKRCAAARRIVLAARVDDSAIIDSLFAAIAEYFGSSE